MHDGDFMQFVSLILHLLVCFSLFYEDISSLFLIKCPNVKPSEDFDSRPDYQAPPVEKQRKNTIVDELTASLLRGHESTPHVSAGKAGNFYRFLYWIFQFCNGHLWLRKYDITVLQYVFSRRQCTFLSKTSVWTWSCLTFRLWFGKVVGSIYDLSHIVQ